MFKKNEEAVSPVIGTILMVAITVILASVIAMFGFGFGAPDAKGPTASIQLGNVPDTPVIDMKITHKGGDSLRAGDWKLSIVPAGQVPVYQASSTDFKVGDEIITYNLTSGTGNYTITNTSIYTTGTNNDILVANGKYEVKIIVYPFKTMVTDAVVSVR